MRELIKNALGPIFEGVLRFIPDRNERERAREAFEGQLLDALVGLVQGQIDTNIEQAKHPSVFVAGARPFLLWVCGFGYLWQYLLAPWLGWIGQIIDPTIPLPPSLDIGPLATLTLGMLGLGGLRTYEKRLGVARNSL